MGKSVFWQALIVAFLVFWAGILVGVIFENGRVAGVTEESFDTQTDLSDFISAAGMYVDFNLSCGELVNKSIYLADKVYKEAEKLEKYDNSNKITERMKALHRRYDFLRTVLWINLIRVGDKCPGSFHRVVYLYKYEDVGIDERGVQSAISNLLTDLKMKYGDKIVLIPIASDSDLESLNILREKYGIKKVPCVIVDEKRIFENLDDLKNLEGFLAEGS